MQAVPLVTLFSLSAIYLPVLMAVGLLYMTQARTGEMLRAMSIDAALCVVSILAGLPYGVVGVAAALTAGGLLVRAPVAFWLSTRRGPVSTAAVWRAIAPAISAAAAVAVSVWYMREFVIHDTAPTLGGILSIAITALLATTLVLLIWPETRREMRDVLHRRAVLI
jgi:PST family polysaccharide transporter